MRLLAVGFLLTLTSDGKTLLKGGIGRFYDRVPLMAATFPDLPNRTVSVLGQNGQPISSVSYQNQIDGELRNPRSTSWNLELDRQVLASLAVRIAYEQRNTSDDIIVSPVSHGTTGILELSNRGSDSYREFQVAARFKAGQHLLNASRMSDPAPYGDLNDLNQFFGNLAQPVIDPDARGRLPFDAPNRFLVLGHHRRPVETDGRTGLRPAYGLPVFDSKRVSRVCRAPQRGSFPDLLIVRYSGVPTNFHCPSTADASLPEWARELSTYSTTLIPVTCRTILPARDTGSSSIRPGENTAANSFWSFRHETFLLTDSFVLGSSFFDCRSGKF